MDGVARCARYAFGPNRLHFCGPDANKEILEYINDGFSDFGLEKLLRGFETMYPYLREIATRNNIEDPFDERVVDAYWIGNTLLDNINTRELYRHLTDDQKIDQKMSRKVFEIVKERIGRGGFANHSFHVLNIWKRTGHTEDMHTLETMDACRVSWGKVIHVGGPFVGVEREPLSTVDGKLFLGDKIKKRVVRQLESEIDIENLKMGDYITIHWDRPCEVVTEDTIKKLRYYTMRAITIANNTS